jgi:hypothetical protein
MTEKRARGLQEETTPPARLQERPSRPPAPSQEARLDRYMKQATESMRRLGGFAGTIDDNLSAKTADSEDAPPPPPRATSEQARHAGGMLRAALSRFPRPEPRRAGTEEEFLAAASGNDVPEQIVHEDDFSAVPELANRQDSRYGSYATEIAGQWLPQIVGGDISGRMSSTPPVLCDFQETEGMSGGQLFMELQMIGSLGGYLVGTNAIIINDDILDYPEAEARHVLLHEMLHYAAYLGGGKSVRWRDEDGRPVFKGDAPAWNMHEGMTELLAQETVRERGFDTGRIGYPAETVTCLYVEQLLGEGGHGVFLQAYLHGDFTQVRTRLDAALGAGAFDALISKRSPAEALAYITARMDERGIDHSGWDEGPIAALARAKLEGGH